MLAGRMLRLLLIGILALTLGLSTVARAKPKPRPNKPPAAQAKAPAGKKQAKPGKKVKKPKKKLVCTGKGKKRRCREVVVAHRGYIHYQPVPREALRTAPMPRPSGRIVITVPGLGRDIDVNIYNPDGSYNQAALAQLDELWRCRRTREVRAVDPRLYEVLSTIYDHYGRRVLLVSGFRFQRNEGSRHFHASAMDIRVEGVPYRDLYEFAQTLDPGGMGIGQYPRMDFVHIDFRGPGEPSMRWTDTGTTNPSDPGKQPSRSWKRSARPNS